MIAGSVDVVQCDTPVAGGTMPAISLMRMSAAAGSGSLVLPHTCPEISIDLAAACRNVIAVGMFSAGIDLYQTDNFLSPALECTHGKAATPEWPELGFQLDSDGLFRYAI